MIDLAQYTVILVALSPLALLLAIWAIEYAVKYLTLGIALLMGLLGLKIMGEP